MFGQLLVFWTNFCCLFYIGIILGEAIGSESTLPYLSPQLRGERLLVGANFASAGIGVLNDTGIQFVSSIILERNVAFLFIIIIIETKKK